MAARTEPPDDVDELKTAFEQAVAAYNSHDLETFMASLHDDLVQFSSFGPFPAVGKIEVRQYHQTTFTHNDSATLPPITPQFRVIGTTGSSGRTSRLLENPKTAR